MIKSIMLRVSRQDLEQAPRHRTHVTSRELLKQQLATSFMGTMQHAARLEAGVAIVTGASRGELRACPAHHELHVSTSYSAFRFFA
jgi:hypothetical protein